MRDVTQRKVYIFPIYNYFWYNIISVLEVTDETKLEA